MINPNPCCRKNSLGKDHQSWTSVLSKFGRRGNVRSRLYNIGRRALESGNTFGHTPWWGRITEDEHFRCRKASVSLAESSYSFGCRSLRNRGRGWCLSVGKVLGRFLPAVISGNDVEAGHRRGSSGPPVANGRHSVRSSPKSTNETNLQALLVHPVSVSGS